MPRRPDTPERLLTTVLFTDIVGSSMGDRGWRNLLSRHHGYVRKVLKRYRGREIDTAGDGFFATFDQPARAIACARDLVSGLHAMGIEIRAGVHMGEVEVIGPKVGGIAVHIGSRVMAKSEPGEILVSGTVRDLMSGSDIRFEDRGVQELKGVPAQWHLFAVEAPAAREETVEPAPPETERPSRSRTPMVVAAAFGLAVIAGLAVLLLTRGGEPGFTPAPNTVVHIDPASGHVAGGAAVGSQPTAVAYGEGSVWVANYLDRTIQRIDPRTNVAGSGFGGLSGNPTGIAVGGGFAWVTTFQGEELTQIDPANNLAKPLAVPTGSRAVAFGEGAVWVVNDVQGTVIRIDPMTQSLRSIELPAGAAPSGVAVGGGSVWVADPVGAKVYRIDASSNRLMGSGTPVLSGQPEQVAFGQGFVWVTDKTGNSVTRIDPATGAGVAVDGVGNGPSGIAAGPEGVWFTNSRDGTVARIDPRNAKVVQTVRLGFSPEGIAVGGGAVWVALHSR